MVMLKKSLALLVYSSNSIEIFLLAYFFKFRLLRKCLLFLICVFLSQILHAQNPHDQIKRANIWYFGTMIADGTKCAGLDFSSGSPVPLTNGFGGATEG